jgi:hypothetical protein
MVSSEESWHAARLIPTSGINGADEQERRATSALLAVMSAVREFGRTLTQPLGAPAAAVQTFIEVPFELEGRKVIPDGLIRVVRGQRSWTALVEVKTGANALQAEQLENYLDVARDRGFDAVITISNEIPALPGQHPTAVDRRKVKKVALRFDALVRFACLQLGRRLGAEVTPALTRKELAEPQTRVAKQVGQLVAEGRLAAGIHIPGTVGVLQVTADLRAGRVACHVDLDGPREGRPTTRVNWLVRQLKDAPDTVRLEAFALHGRGAGASELLKTVKDDPMVLVVDPAKEIRGFRVANSAPLGTKRGIGRNSFIDSVLGTVTGFYEDVVQNLKPWAAAPPRIRPEEAFAPPVDVPPALVSTAPSSQDGP